MASWELPELNGGLELGRHGSMLPEVPGSIHVFVPMQEVGNGSKSIDDMKTISRGTVSLTNKFMYHPVS